MHLLRQCRKKARFKSVHGWWRERYHVQRTDDRGQKTEVLLRLPRIFINKTCRIAAHKNLSSVFCHLSSENQSPLSFCCTNACKSGLSVCVSSACLNASLASALRCSACKEIPMLKMRSSTH